MIPTYIIGIDVGGTNTDAVLLNSSNHEIISSIKTSTTKDFVSGVSKAFEGVLLPSIHSENIAAVMIGTTTFLNAVLEQSNELARVYVIRLCGPSSTSYPPFTDFPPSLIEKIKGDAFMVNGGYEFDKEEISSVDENEIINIGEKLISRDEKLYNIVISGVFSVLDNLQEVKCATILSGIFEKAAKNYSITLSSTFGTLGLLEREAASILNASLKPLALKTVHCFEDFLEKHKISKKRLFFTKNDGTITSINFAKNYPIYTFNSGPTNSLRGAYLLTKIPNALVADIGGTSTDITMLKNGYPRPSSAYIRIGGVRTNFRMPDTYCVGLGGGSIIEIDQNNEITIGPNSVGFNLTKFSKTFGGKTLTTTDIAVASGLADFGLIKDKSKLGIDDDFIQKVNNEIKRKLEIALDQMKTSQEPIPLILVGGGSVLIPKDFSLEGISEIHRPSNFDVANALGAANAQISASLESVVYFENEGREKAIERLREDLIKKIIKNGAKENGIEIFFEEIPLAYIPGKATRICMQAIGDLDFEKLSDLNFEEKDDKFSNLNSFQVESIKKQEDLYIKKLDLPISNSKFSHEKNIQIVNGRSEWILEEIDVDYICCGAGILGTGGGGSPYLGNLLLKKALRSGKQIRIISFEDLKAEDLVSWVAFYGAPLVQIEKLPGETSAIYSLESMREYIKQKNQEISVLMSVEIGGLNSIIPLLLGGLMDIPVLDGDFMGRAFPELQMCTPFFYGAKEPYPLALSDDCHNSMILTHVKEKSPKRAENILRHLIMKLGCFTSLASDVFTKQELQKILIENSLTKAWELGKAVFEARNRKENFVTKLVSKKLGEKIFEGKIIDVTRNIDKGYTRGVAKISGINEFSKRELVLDFQNENLIAREIDTQNNMIEKAKVPNLISVLDSENYEAIMTEEYKYGLRVICIAMECHPLLRNPEALKFCGPQAFGYT